MSICLYRYVSVALINIMIWVSQFVTICHEFYQSNRRKDTGKASSVGRTRNCTWPLLEDCPSHREVEVACFSNISLRQKRLSGSSSHRCCRHSPRWKNNPIKIFYHDTSTLSHLFSTLTHFPFWQVNWSSRQALSCSCTLKVWAKEFVSQFLKIRLIKIRT